MSSLPNLNAKLADSIAKAKSEKVRRLGFSKRYSILKFSDRSDDMIRSNFGSDVLKDFLASSSVDTYLKRGTAYRSIVFLSLVGILKRRKETMTEECLIGSLKLISEIIERSNEPSLKTDKFSGIVFTFGYLMNALITLKKCSTEDAYKLFSPGPRVMAFIGTNARNYE